MDVTGRASPLHPLEADGACAKDRTLLLSAIPGDAINLLTTKMAESSPGLTYAVVLKVPVHPRRNLSGGPGRSWTITSIAYAFAAHWGDGTTSSSPMRPALPGAGGRGESTGHVNPKYGSEPGRLFYTHLTSTRRSAPARGECRRPRFHLMCSTAQLYHESGPADRSETMHRRAGFTDRLALMHLGSFAAAHPRPRRNQAVRAAGRASSAPDGAR